MKENKVRVTSFAKQRMMPQGNRYLVSSKLILVLVGLSFQQVISVLTIAGIGNPTVRTIHGRISLLILLSGHVLPFNAQRHLPLNMV